MKKNKYLYIAISYLILGLLIACYVNLYFNASLTIQTKKNIENNTYNSLIANINGDYSKQQNDKVTIDLTFIGDSLLASSKGIRRSGNFLDLLETHDYTYPYKNVSDLFKEDDFTIANGENVFTDKELSEIAKDYNPAYWYYSSSKFANIYKASSIEVVSTMNNHTYDYGNQGYLDTIEALKKADVTYGAFDEVILEKEEIKIGLICCNLFHKFQANEVVKKIKQLKNETNYIIVYFHGGVEYQYKPTSDIINYAHKISDAGANLIIGCHPHVLQPIENYKNSKIVYSLGSFLFGDRLTFSNKTIIYQINLEFDLKTKAFMVTDKIIPCYIYGKEDRWLPEIIENDNEKKKVIDFMNGLRETPE